VHAGNLTLGVKWPGREVDHLPPTMLALTMTELYHHSPIRPPGVQKDNLHVYRLFRLVTSKYIQQVLK